ncbi:hypothetical protein HOY82DRAFT_624030 [Tuber indicum]|nr:hypothetical protein HOY82DRAFT_624030 [Tuber indicum]
MAYSYGGSSHKVSSRHYTKQNLPHQPYTLVGASEYQSPPKPELGLTTHLDNQSGNKPWRPFTLRAPTIMASILITVALIILIEYINKVSLEKKALFFAERPEEFSTGVVFCYRYMPQIVVVVLGVGWAAVDLDVKRLEPYFQLSKSDGASASNSISLHYPFEFIAFVPIRAARKGHWNVFWAGLALCLIFWVVTPLNSSLLTTQPVVQNVPTLFKPFQKFTSFDNQIVAMSSSFLHTSYCITWLGQKVPKFMTKELMAVPFKPASYSEGQHHLTRGKEFWTAQTRVYQTELECAPAEMVSLNGTIFHFKLDNFTYPINLLSKRNETRLMIIFRRTTNFLAIWAKSRNANNSIANLDTNVLNCKSTYYYRTHEVTVEGADGSILQSKPVGERTSFTQSDEIIDVENFEGIANNMTSSAKANASYLGFSGLTSMTKFDHWRIETPTRRILYVFGLSEGKKFDDFKDPKVFEDGLDRMYKLLFSSALQTLLVPDSGGEEILGSRAVRSVGIVVVPLIAHILSYVLGVVAVCLCGVFVITYKRENNLASDPDTLGTKMALVACSKTLLRDFDGIDECPSPHLCMESRKYKLGTWGGEGRYRLDVHGKDNPLVQNLHATCPLPHDGKLVSPIELSIWTGVAATLVNIALLTLLVVLYRSASQWKGLPILSDIGLVTQIIFSFTPTAVATLLEPFWVLVGRYLALYQPYTALRRGNASPNSSLGLKYTNTPPVLIAPRALRRGHIILFLASMIVIAANFLAVALGGIFDRGFKPITSDLIVTYPFTTSINTEIQTAATQGNLPGTFAKDSWEHWLVVNTNVMEKTDLPAWVTEEFYFLPFEWGKQGNESDSRTSITQGYGVNLTCGLLAGDSFKQHYRGRHVSRTSYEVHVTVPILDGDSVHCRLNISIDIPSLEPGTRPFALEWASAPIAPDTRDPKATESCSSLILAGWGRGEANPEDPRETIQSHTTIACNQQISTGEFKVTVDGNGRVKRSELIGQLKYNDPRLFNHSTTIRNFTAQLGVLFGAHPMGGHQGVMHDDNSAHIFPQFIGEYLTNKTLSNPGTPPPSFEEAQHALSTFYKRFIAILLAQNKDRIFVRAAKVPRSQVGELESLQPRMSMDPVMFYMAVAVLGFQIIAGAIIFLSRPRCLLPRFPYTLASEIGFFHASAKAMSDIAGTEHMSSAMRSKHLAGLGWTYSFGKFRGSDGKEHVGIERMSLIKDYEEEEATRRRE